MVFLWFSYGFSCTLLRFCIDCPPHSPGALRPSATQWGEAAAEARGAQVTTAGAGPDGLEKWAHFAMEKHGVIKCPHFSHHPTMNGIWSTRWLL